ncbi:VOC family protein [Neoaquamicrobium sediminum]|uniref:VOC family protein n=1 Tax=Neoaquamicrobium sediminum TaxID=1849104 RepID=A0ABV3WTL6_9HYPH
MTENTVRALDHLVLPTANLDVARKRLGALGFTVAPQGVHPFGTTNACVYFADGTFLEPLAIGDRDTVKSAAVTGNSFILRDRLFRGTYGDEGLSAVVFATKDAEADHAAFVDTGISAGPMVEFSRPSLDAAGRADVASFRLAFASDGSPGAFLFTCERRKVPAIDRSTLEGHANGATRITQIDAVAPDAEAFARFLSKAANASVTAARKIALANGMLDVSEASQAADPRFTAVTFGIRDLAAASALFNANGIDYETRENALRVPATAGQGVDFIFEETR